MVREQLRERGISEQRVLQAMEQVPRELFVPVELREAAYDDRALDIGLGQTISQPYIVAYMTAKLDVQPDHRVLEIGTGSGYQTAVLATLCRSVYSIESVGELLRQARLTLETLGIANVHYKSGDGTLGWPEQAPFDRIVVTAGSARVPPPLLQQLAPGGKLIIPVGPEKAQQLMLFEKRLDRMLEYPLIACRFVKLIGQHGWRSESTT